MFGDQPSGSYAPHRRLPSKDSLEYAKVAFELLLLLLAVPWLIRELSRNPGRLSRRAATKHIAG